MLDTKNLCLIGFKILSAVAVGAAVVLGIDKLTGNKSQQPPQQNISVDNSNVGNSMIGGNNMPIVQNSGNTTCDNILEGLRTTQNICKGVISVGAAIGGVVQCIGQLTNCINGGGQQFYNSGGGYQGNPLYNMNNTVFENYYNQRYNQPQMMNMNSGEIGANGKEPLTLVRRSAYVVSCVPVSEARRMEQQQQQFQQF